MPEAKLIEISRVTKETEISLKLDLSGSGQTDISTEHFFLKHMLESLATHGRFDLTLTASGDDEHHLIEDVGIALGQAIRQGVPNLNIVRIAHSVVPMDDALVLVAVDLVDRPYAEIQLPDPMYTHMIRSMALEGRFTLHARVLSGHDTHHIVEAAFKALGRALRAAVEPADTVSSTKGRVEWA